jgi:excisionase family DNA binding protein
VNTANFPQAALLLDIPVAELEARLAAPAQASAEAVVPALCSKSPVQRRLGVSAATLNRMLRAGEIPHVQIGSRVLIDPEDVEAFIRRAKSRKPRSGPGRPRAAIANACREQVESRAGA